MKAFLISILSMVYATVMSFAGEYTTTFKDNGTGAGDDTTEFLQTKDTYEDEVDVTSFSVTFNIKGEGSVVLFDMDNESVTYEAGTKIPNNVNLKARIMPASGWDFYLATLYMFGMNFPQPVGADLMLPIGTLSQDLVFNIEFQKTAEDTHAITITKNGEGTVTIKDVDNNEYASGAAIPASADLTLTVSPAEGWQLASVILDGTTAPVVDGTYHIGTLNDDQTLVVTFEEASAKVDYCHPEGPANSKDTPKGITKIVVTDDKGNSVEVAGSGTDKTHALYTDATETVLVTEPGATINIQNNGAGSWMSTYVYIDYNGNGTFDFDPDKCDENIVGTTGPNVDGELVAHTGYNTAKHATNADTADPSVASDGTKLSGEKYSWSTSFNNAVPAFTLPEDLKPGDYRIRHKMDWNSVNPCGRVTSADLVGVQGGNFMGVNGGGIIDFTIRIESHDPRAITVVSAQPELGSVAIIEPETTGNTVTVAGPVTIKATATDADAYFVNWTNAAGDVVSTEAEYTYGKGEEATFTANFRQHYLLTVVDAENGTTVKAGTTVVESGSYVDKGTELTVTCSVEEKILKSLMINEVEKVEEYVATGYVFTMNEATSIEVEYAMPVYEVGELAVEGEGTLVVAEGVTAEGAPSGATFAEGAELEKGSEPMVIATPAAQYKIESMIVDGFAVVTEGKPMEEDEYVSTYADGRIVAYQAYIEGSLKASVKFVRDGSAIESIGADEAGDAEFFNLQGIRVARENLVPGIYIMRNAEGARKVSVK